MEGKHSTQSGQAGQLSDDERLANRLARLQQDLDETLDLLKTRQRLSEGVPGLTTDFIESAKRACISSAVVAYCRAFVHSSGAKFAVPRLELGVAPIGKEKWASDTHDSLLKARHKIIAHSDWEYHHSALIRPGPFHIGTARVFSLPVLEASLNVDAFKELATTLHFQISVLRRDLDDRIVQNEKLAS